MLRTLLQDEDLRLRKAKDQAGAASAPIVASAFSPSLAPVGVLLAVLGYAVGTVGAILCMEWMHAISM